jgi:putative DNA primase/helicase
VVPENFAAWSMNRQADALVLDPRAPFESAREFLQRRFMPEGKRTLHYHHGVFYAWTGSSYAEIAEADLRAQIYEFLATALRPLDKGIAAFNPDRAKVGDLLDALKAAAHLPSSVRPTAWLGPTADLPADEIIACQNCLLHLPSLESLSHSPEFFTLNGLSFDYLQDAPTPVHWLKFLLALWPEDPQSIETLQEIFGLCLTADTRHQKAFLLVGPKRSGKGTIARVLTALVGPDNVAGPTLSSLAQNFGLAPLVGKRLAVISDARLSPRADQHVIAERLLSITGEDSLTVDRKYLPPWTGRLQARFLLLSNELPKLTDASGALASRFIVLALSSNFYGNEDKTLAERLLRELPSILKWAIGGWRRLAERGFFIQPPSAFDMVRTLEDLGSPIGAFLRDMCDIGPAFTVGVERLFEGWKEWCMAQGRDHAGTVQAFGRDLRAAVSGLRVSQLTHGGIRSRPAANPSASCCWSARTPSPVGDR